MTDFREMSSVIIDLNDMNFSLIYLRVGFLEPTDLLHSISRVYLMSHSFPVKYSYELCIDYKQCKNTNYILCKLFQGNFINIQPRSFTQFSAHKLGTICSFGSSASIHTLLWQIIYIFWFYHFSLLLFTFKLFGKIFHYIVKVLRSYF